MMMKGFLNIQTSYIFWQLKYGQSFSSFQSFSPTQIQPKKVFWCHQTKWTVIQENAVLYPKSFWIQNLKVLS